MNIANLIPIAPLTHNRAARYVPVAMPVRCRPTGEFHHPRTELSTSRRRYTPTTRQLAVVPACGPGVTISPSGQEHGR